MSQMTLDWGLTGMVLCGKTRYGLKELAMFDYLETKRADELIEGDLITLTGYTDEIAEIEEVYPEGDEIAVKTNDGRGKYLDTCEPIKVYTMEVL